MLVTYIGNMAWIEHEDESLRLNLVHDIENGDHSAGDGHEEFHPSGVQSIHFFESLLFLFEVLL